MPRELLQIWTMPWAKFSEAFEFGEIRFWDFYRHGPQKITDSQEMLWLSQYMACFKDANDIQLADVTVVQTGNEPFGPLGDSGFEKIRWASLAIAFAYLIGAIHHQLLREPKSPFVGGSERFQLEGSVIRDGQLFYSDCFAVGTSDLLKHRPTFRQPPQVGFMKDLPDRLLLKGLAYINDTQFDTEIWQQLLVCFEWFTFGWTASPDVSNSARFIALMTSFEALIKEEREGRYDMAKSASSFCGWTNLPETESVRINKRDVPCNKPIRFLCDYAEHRNSLVHGKHRGLNQISLSVGEKEFEPRMVMSMVLYSIVANKLIELNVWEDIEKMFVINNLSVFSKNLHWYVMNDN